MILMYHNIGRESGFNTVSISDLKEQMSYVKDRFTIVSADEYINSLDNLNGKVLITIDDAYVGFSEYFYPYLQNYKIPSILFVPAGYPGKYNDWDKQGKINIMDWNEITGISREGLTEIGSHGVSHRRFSTLTEAETLSEFRISKQMIEDKISKPVKHFCFPYGQICDYTKFAVNNLEQCGYLSSCSTRYGISNSRKNIFELRRVEVEPSDNIASFKKKCESRFHKKLFRRYVKEMLIRTSVLK
jgi:peptidoglycan/xylan/chitin deacetylase (PgdA/CDA1 family)